MGFLFNITAMLLTRVLEVHFKLGFVNKECFEVQKLWVLGTCDEMPSCTSGCFCADQMVLYDGVCSNATLCSGMNKVHYT